MRLFKQLGGCLLASLVWVANVNAEDYHIKYDSNYVMPAEVHFKNSTSDYSVNAKINVPFYRIQFFSKGIKTANQFKMLDYKDLRNDKLYSMSKINNNQLTYGKVKKENKTKTRKVKYPVFDLFTMAYQLSYFDKLPKNFYITNGKKIYLMKNVIVKKLVKAINNKSQKIKEISYIFSVGNKDIIVKKYENEKFPRYISYNKEGDNYELKFNSFIK